MRVHHKVLQILCRFASARSSAHRYLYRGRVRRAAGYHKLSEVKIEISQKIACSKTHSCGHACGGVKDETACLPCMKCPNKREKSEGYGRKTVDRSESRQDADDVCVICLCERLGAAPSLQLASVTAEKLVYNFPFSRCGHVFHYGCLRAVLSRRWLGPRILFRFMACPLCNVQVRYSVGFPSSEQTSIDVTRVARIAARTTRAAQSRGIV